jgi:hypothetical protein
MTATFSEKHPQYTDKAADYIVSKDCFDGEKAIKRKTTAYLPATSGHISLGIGTADKPGSKLYASYLTRAVFPEIVRETVNALVGIMTREKWIVKLPEKLEGLRDRATSRSEPLDTLIRRILESQLLYGRRGLLLDVDTARDLPYIADYSAEQIINWDDVSMAGSTTRKLTLVVVDESESVRKPGELTWANEERYRVLTLGGLNGDGSGPYTAQVERDGNRGEEVVPDIRANKLDKIPFVFINSADLVPEPGELPLIGLARLALTIYRGEADYRQALFMTSQDTLVITGVNVGGGNDDTTGGTGVIIGAGAMINIPSEEGDAKFIGVSGTGLAEARQSLENDYNRASQYGVGMLSGGSGAEAAETLRIRVASRTATLKTIVGACAEGLEEILKTAAEWMGANPDEVEVEANTDFIENDMSAEELVKLVAAKVGGAPMSWQTVHDNMKKRGVTDKEFEDEVQLILAEVDLLPDFNLGEPEDTGVDADGAE